MRSIVTLCAGGVAATISCAQAATVDWTGWYWGGNAGYSKAEIQTKRTITGTGYLGAPDVAAIVTKSQFDLDKGGVTAGFQYGYNQNLGSVVVGAETDFDYSSLSDSASATAVYPCCAPSTFTSVASFDQNWLATLRGRVGVTAGPALLFVSAGLAAGSVSVTQGFGDTAAPIALTTQRRSDILLGWTAGAGLETPAFEDVTLRLEYLYVDLGDVTAGPSPFIPGYPNRLSETTASVTNQSLRLAVNWQY